MAGCICDMQSQWPEKVQSHNKSRWKTAKLCVDCKTTKTGTPGFPVGFKTINFKYLTPEHFKHSKLQFSVKVAISTTQTTDHSVRAL